MMFWSCVRFCYICFLHFGGNVSVQQIGKCFFGRDDEERIWTPNVLDRRTLMVALNFNAHAFAFQSGLDTIEQGYEAAVNGITLEINRKKAAFYDYCRYIENGGARTEERTEEHTYAHQSLMRTSYDVFCLKT